MSPRSGRVSGPLPGTVVRGKVVSIEEDADLSDIDRISRHYTAEPYPDRDRGRYSAWIEVEAWWGWAVSRPWQPDA